MPQAVCRGPSLSGRTRLIRTTCAGQTHARLRVDLAARESSCHAPRHISTSRFTACCACISRSRCAVLHTCRYPTRSYEVHEEGEGCSLWMPVPRSNHPNDNPSGAAWCLLLLALCIAGVRVTISGVLLGKLQYHMAATYHSCRSLQTKTPTPTQTRLFVHRDTAIRDRCGVGTYLCSDPPSSLCQASDRLISSSPAWDR